MNRFFSKIASNWKSGLTVSLVSIPLSVSLAVASQAPPVMGIITAVYAGLVSSIFGGSDYNVIGPTGALSGMLAIYALQHGAQVLPILAIYAGVLVILAYFMKVGRYLAFIPGATIHGFTLGVACIIGLSQLNFALGLSDLPKHEGLIENVIETLKHIQCASFITILLFFFSLALLFIFKKFLPLIPGTIIVAPLGIILGLCASNQLLPLCIQTLGTLYPTMSFSLFLPYSFYFDISLLTPALAISLVAILETMLSARIADGMTNTRHHKQHEIRGLALANIVSGIMGGMPATAALARTSLNIKTGATNKISSTMSSIFIALISLLLLNYFKFIPLAVIAAILVYVALQMIEVKHFKTLYRYDKKNFVISLIVAFITIVKDPIAGIILGVAISCLLLLEKISHGQFDLIFNENQRIIGRLSSEELKEVVKHSDTIVYSIKGLLCYINSEAHIERLTTILGDAKNVILRLRSVHYIDMDGVETFNEIIRLVESQGKNIYVTSVNPIIAEMLQESHNYRKLKSEGRIFNKSSDALRYLGFQV